MQCPKCGLTNQDSVQQCDCGFRFVGDPAASDEGRAVANFRVMGVTSRARPASRDGRILVVERGATLPPNCVKCGLPAAKGFRTKQFTWHSPALYLLAFCGLLLYFIVALIVRKKLSVSFALCDEHLRSYGRLKRIAAGLLLGFIPAGFVIGAWSGGWAALVMATMVIAGAVVFSLADGPLTAERIDEGVGRFRGACDSFLSLLPTVGKPDLGA